MFSKRKSAVASDSPDSDTTVVCTKYIVRDESGRSYNISTLAAAQKTVKFQTPKRRQVPTFSSIAQQTKQARPSNQANKKPEKIRNGDILNATSHGDKKDEAKKLAKEERDKQKRLEKEQKQKLKEKEKEEKTKQKIALKLGQDEKRAREKEAKLASKNVKDTPKETANVSVRKAEEPAVETRPEPRKDLLNTRIADRVLETGNAEAHEENDFEDYSSTAASIFFSGEEPEIAERVKHTRFEGIYDSDSEGSIDV